MINNRRLSALVSLQMFQTTQPIIKISWLPVEELQCKEDKYWKKENRQKILKRTFNFKYKPLKDCLGIVCPSESYKRLNSRFAVKMQEEGRQKPAQEEPRLVNHWRIQEPAKDRLSGSCSCKSETWLLWVINKSVIILVCQRGDMASECENGQHIILQ